MARGPGWGLNPVCCPQNYTSAPHCLEALQELYTHIHRYYDQVRPRALWGEWHASGARSPEPRGRPQESPWGWEEVSRPNLGREERPRLGEGLGVRPDSSGRSGSPGCH